MYHFSKSSYCLPPLIKEVLLGFILCGCRMKFHFLSASLLLCQILVFKRRCLCVNFQTTIFIDPILSDPLWYSLTGSYPFALYHLFIRGGGAKLEVWVDLNAWVCVGLHDAISARNIYCAKSNPETDAHYIYWVRKGIKDQDLRITQE